MNHTQETPAREPLRRFLRNASDLPGRLEAALRSRPVVTTIAIAGVAFVAGTITGSRVARAFLVAAAPVVAQRLLNGPLGDDLAGYVKSIFRSPVSRDVS
jgi:hypothetical protein